MMTRAVLNRILDLGRLSFRGTVVNMTGIVFCRLVIEVNFTDWILTWNGRSEINISSGCVKMARISVVISVTLTDVGRCLILVSSLSTMNRLTLVT